MTDQQIRIFLSQPVTFAHLLGFVIGMIICKIISAVVLACINNMP